ncbi:MAG: hypothetical protein HOF68_12520 [Nitrospina sp.]|jgi:hypothetical protein|nr:hypothetical protein [Nitrospina sp.]MBT4048211.1 hypothetical protein [Nitrospina sp.]MBT6249976.1 hypothetical protein [Nitrospina sp.]MBT6738913.1 hypothetical protein [Nitrospina sp.]
MKILFQLQTNRVPTISQFLLVIIFFLLSTGLGEANPTENKEKSSTTSPAKFELPKNLKVGLTYYFDTREYNTLNILTSLSKLPGDINLWGFSDLSGNQGSGNGRFDITRYFLEYRLTRSLFPDSQSALKGLVFEAEHNDSNGPDNDVLRLGLTFKHSIPFLPGPKSWLQWRYHPYETDGTGSQVSVILFLSLTERIFISGFADLNLENDRDNRWVVEPQINFKINETFDLVLETRYNETEDVNKALDGFGLAGGLKVKF